MSAPISLDNDLEVVEYHSHHLVDLLDLYHDLTHVIPHCYPILPEELTAGLDGVCGYEAYGERMSEEAVFVAMDRANWAASRRTIPRGGGFSSQIRG